jgi:hypothetical protein
MLLPITQLVKGDRVRVYVNDEYLWGTVHP